MPSRKYATSVPWPAPRNDASVALSVAVNNTISWLESVRVKAGVVTDHADPLADSLEVSMHEVAVDTSAPLTTKASVPASKAVPDQVIEGSDNGAVTTR